MTYRRSARYMETSCGVVLVNYGAVLLLQYPQGHWDFPKGHVEDADEDHHATARRELEEETGISEIDFIPDFVERTEYSYRHKGKKRTKQVYWYLAETERISVSLSHEHRGHMWLDWEQAIDQLSHKETMRVLENAHQHMVSIGKE
ncbi:NUDIX domain-containing protein [Euryarchaeota archaeon]|nr:NUDIX domain-containing protein [Euryarchaeota archaeon]